MSPHPNTLLCIFWMGRGTYKPSRSAAAAACPYELSNSSHAKHKNVIFVVLKPARADDDATQNASSHYVYCGDGLLVIPYFRNAKTRKILEQQIKNTFSNYTTFNRYLCRQITGQFFDTLLKLSLCFNSSQIYYIVFEKKCLILVASN